MYITVSSTKRNIGFKGLELTDLVIGIPLIFILLLMFSFKGLRMLSIILLVITVFMFLPVTLSKKNRMYKIMFLAFSYLKRNKKFIYFKDEKENKLYGRKFIKL